MIPGRRRAAAILLLAALAVFLGWRLLRPLQIFVVSEAFERPVRTETDWLPSLSAESCGTCHGAIHAEWQSSIHRRAWTDPYFQDDWRFDGAPQICRNCHTPLDRQQPLTVVGFRDAEKWDPIGEPNPGFDAALQSEGVTCTGCHLRQGRILGPRGDTRAPHPVTRLQNGNEICIRCHVVSGGDRWDTFFRFPPCGTVAEIEAAGFGGRSSEVVATKTEDLGCVDCHMPGINRAVANDGPKRDTRRHLWRGGHDPEMLRRSITIRFDPHSPKADEAADEAAEIMLTNTGAAHFVPTGTPDRHLAIALRAWSAEGRLLAEERDVLKRRVLWRPLIVDLHDNRLRPGMPHRTRLTLPRGTARVEAEVVYHLVDQRRLDRIGHVPKEPLRTVLFHETRAIAAPSTGAIP